MTTSISVLGLVLALLLLAFLCMKSVNLYVAAISASAVAIIFSGMPLGETLVGTYGPGFASFISGYFFRYLWGTVFGVLMEKCGAAHAVANGIIKVFGRRYCLVALPIAVAVLAYSGMSGTVSVFVVLPIFLRVFKAANLPRRYIPGLFLFGAGTFINCAPGSAQNLNIIATRSVGLDPAAGVLVGLVGSITVFVLGILWTIFVVGRATARGETYVDREDDKVIDRGTDVRTPPVLLALIPMLIVIFCINFSIDGSNVFSVETGVFLGCLSTPILMFRYTDFKTLLKQVGEGAEKSLTMLGATSAMTGFGMVIMATPAYETLTNFALNLNMSPLITLAIAMSIICACTASATSAAGIVGPTLGPTFVNMGVNPVAVARVMAISATGFDSVPQNGTIVMVINVLCGETYKNAYPYVFVMNLVIPLIGTAATILACTVVY